MEYQVTASCSYEVLMKYLQSLPDRLAGIIGDDNGIALPPLAHAVHAMYTAVHKDYLQKSTGAVGEDGVHWPPLAPETIRKRMGRMYSTMMKAKRMEARIAGNKHPGRIAKRKLMEEVAAGKYGQFPILIDKKPLVESMAPGRLSGGGLSVIYFPATANQKVDIKPGVATMATTVVNPKSSFPYWKAHQDSDRSSYPHLPRREFVPDRIPESWMQSMCDAYAESTASAVAEVVTRI